MKALSLQRFLRTIRAINCSVYLISKKIRVATIIPVSCYCGAVLGYLHATGLRSLDVPYIFFSRDAFPPNSYAVEWATNSWSLIHQIGYLGYVLGFEHGQISSVISAVTGAAMVTGLALLIYAISRNGLVAILAAPVIATYRVSRILDADYASQYIGSEHLSWQGSAFVILTLGVASVGFFRSAGFLAVLTTCIHVLLGAWSTMLLGVFMTLLFFQKRRDRVFAIVKGLSVGAVFLLASLLVDRFFFTTNSAFLPDDNALLVWSKFWGLHRAYEFDIAAIVGAYVCGALILLFIRYEKRRHGRYDYAVALTLLFSVVVSPLLYIAGSVELGGLSEILTRVVPGRFMLFNIFFVLIFLIGFLFRFDFRRISKNYFVRPVLIILLFSALPSYLLLALPFAVIAMIAAAQYRKASQPRPGPFLNAANSAIAVIFFAGTILFTANTGVGGARAVSIDDGAECRGVAVEGLVLAASYRQYAISQRGCGLPVLLDPSATNSLPYIPWAAREMRRLISVAYGVSLANPPVATRNSGKIIESAFRHVWETRTAAEWARIADQFGVGAVMVPPDWSLALGSPIAAGASFKLYSVR